MRSDNRLVVIIFVALTAVVLGIVGARQLRERMRPRLLEARIITATADDPVFRDGPRHVAAGADVQIAVALRVGRDGARGRWLAPATDLVLRGEPVQHTEITRWPDPDLAVRVFWFTVESSNVGGELTAADAGRRLRYRTFLAPEMGRSLRAAAYPQVHDDDQFEAIAEAPPDSGTIRLYARVEVYDPEHESVPLEAAATETADRVLEPDYPAISRSAELASGIPPVLGELFDLPGFEPVAAAGGNPDEITREAFGLGFTELVERRLLASSGTFAAVATGGEAALEPPGLTSLGEVQVTGGRVRRQGRPLRWGKDVRAGDVLQTEGRWLVLVEDDGDGMLDAGDRAAWCWRSPPTLGALGDAVMGATILRLQRHGP